MGTNLFSPPDPGGTVCKKPCSSSLPPREKREREEGWRNDKREILIKVMEGKNRKQVRNGSLRQEKSDLETSRE